VFDAEEDADDELPSAAPTAPPSPWFTAAAIAIWLFNANAATSQNEVIQIWLVTCHINS
jgi:hypothetical protein